MPRTSPAAPTVRLSHVKVGKFAALPGLHVWGNGRKGTAGPLIVVSPRSITGQRLTSTTGHVYALPKGPAKAVEAMLASILH